MAGPPPYYPFLFDQLPRQVKKPGQKDVSLVSSPTHETVPIFYRFLLKALFGKFALTPRNGSTGVTSRLIGFSLLQTSIIFFTDFRSKHFSVNFHFQSPQLNGSFTGLKKSAGLDCVFLLDQLPGLAWNSGQNHNDATQRV